MASVTGTFTAAQQVSTDLMLAPGESLNVIVTRTGAADFSVSLLERVTGDQYALARAAFTADTAGTAFPNDQPRARYFRLLCGAIGGGNSIAYTLEDTAGESLAGYPVRNASGVVVFDIADDGIEAPKGTFTTVVGTLSTAAQPNITSTGVLAAPVVTKLNVGAAEAAAAGQTKITKTVTAIANATPADVLTITVPNASHAAVVRVTILASLGAGGTVGARECSGTISYDIVIGRTAGVNAVGTASSAYGSAVMAVAGATTITVTGALSAVTGAVGASNSFTVTTTITRGGGSSANHTAIVSAEVLNAAATGISIA
jgi:hypothetical protein